MMARQQQRQGQGRGQSPPESPPPPPPLIRERVRLGFYVSVEDWNDNVGILRHRGRSFVMDGSYIRALIRAAKGMSYDENAEWNGYIARLR